MWAQRSSLLTQSTSLCGVLLTLLAQAVGLASVVGVMALALQATGDRATVTATAAAVANASVHPRRRPCRRFIVVLPFLTAKLADGVADEPFRN